MDNLFKAREWDWKISGVMLGLIFLLTVMVVKPIGVSTQFVILDGIVWNAVSSDLVVKDETAKKGYASSNAYLNKSGGKYAKNIANPLNYSFVFVVAMIIGGFIASKMQSEPISNEEKSIPPVWSESIGDDKTKRYIFTFIGGVLILFGARLAGGCSSGHMMSGMMQTSMSGYIFAVATFIAAVPLAMIFYKRGA